MNFSDRHDLGIAALACAGVVLLAVARAVIADGDVFIGSAGAEVYGHAWVVDGVAPAWPALPASTDRLLGGETPWVVIDPAVTWVAAGLARLVGLAAAWNAVVVAAVVAAFWGGFHLGGRVGGDRLVAALTLSLGPIVAGALASGLSEDFAVGLLAFALAEVGREGLGRAARAGVLLGALAWAGLYLALLGAVGAIVIGLAELRGARGRWRELAVAAAVALLLAVPAAARHGERLGGIGHHHGAVALDAEPHWRVNPRRGADVASFVVPGPDPVRDDALIRLHPAYLGLGVLAIAAAAGRRGGRWWVLLAASAVLAVGPAVSVAGVAVATHPIVTLLARGPVGELVNHWGRLLLLGQVALAALAALGATAWRARGARLARVAPIVVAVDYAALSPAPWPLPIADAAVPEVYGATGGLARGGVVVVPSAGPGVPFQRVLYRAAATGRPVALHPNRPGYGVAEDVPLVRWFAGLPGDRRDPPDPRVDESMARLRRLGVAVILVEDPYVDAVTVLLGAPNVRADGGAAWRVR